MRSCLVVVLEFRLEVLLEKAVLLNSNYYEERPNETLNPQF